MVQQLGHILSLNRSKILSGPCTVKMLVHKALYLGSRTQPSFLHMALEPFSRHASETIGRRLPYRTDHFPPCVSSVVDRHWRRPYRAPVLLSPRVAGNHDKTLCTARLDPHIMAGQFGVGECISLRLRLELLHPVIGKSVPPRHPCPRLTARLTLQTRLTVGLTTA